MTGNISEASPGPRGAPSCKLFPLYNAASLIFTILYISIRIYCTMFI